jgi:hypothetical protein
MEFTLYYSINVISHIIRLCFMIFYLIKIMKTKLSIKHLFIILMEVLFIKKILNVIIFIHTLDE